VHHVALRTPTDTTHAAWRDRLDDAGFQVTPVIDRFYFRSIYFMTPSGVLFEIATDGPGMTADEPLERLGERLSLPPFLEGRRAEIEKGLVPL
jgi:glyoxalase family protein